MPRVESRSAIPFPLKSVVAFIVLFSVLVMVFPAAPSSAAAEDVLCGEVLGPDGGEWVSVCGTGERIDLKTQPGQPFPKEYYRFDGAVIESGTPYRVLASWTKATFIGENFCGCYQIFLPLGMENTYGYALGSRIALPTELEGEAPGQNPGWNVRLLSVSAAMVSSFFLMAVFIRKKDE